MLKVACFVVSPKLKPGTYRLEVVSPADATNLAGRSTRLNVTVA